MHEDSPLRPLVKGWMGKLKIAREHKQAVFGKDAEECMRFFSGPYSSWMYNERSGSDTASSLTVDHSDYPAPSFRMTINKASDLEQLFAPVIAHRNPHRTVNPRRFPTLPPEVLGDPMDPMVQQQYFMMEQQNSMFRGQDTGRAILMESLLNYTPHELGLKRQSRMVILEGLIKGAGIWWTELVTRRGTGTRLVGSFYETVDRLLIDPDMDTLEDAFWIARECVHPVWEVERKYGLEPGSLKGNAESSGHFGMSEGYANSKFYRTMGKTNDQLRYWKIYSRMGMGGKMSGELPRQYQDNLDVFGDYCYLVVCDTVPYPLNLPPAMTDQADLPTMQKAVEWEVPFWADSRWPVTMFAPHPIPNCIWPQSHLKPALGLLRAINWLYSMILSKIRVTCRDFLGVVKGAAEDLKKAVQHGPDLTMIELEQAFGNNINNVVQFIQHPTFNASIWDVWEATLREFDKATGLMELVYGQSATQPRSATESQAKAAQTSIRPDDLADKFEDTMSDLAASEAIAIRWLYEPQDVEAIVGPIGAYYWQILVMQADVSATVSQLEYRIEAGSARKQNKMAIAENLANALNNLAPTLMQAGQFEPLSNLLQDWAKANDIDPDRYKLAPPPMPMMPPEGGQPQIAPGTNPEPQAA